VAKIAKCMLKYACRLLSRIEGKRVRTCEKCFRLAGTTLPPNAYISLNEYSNRQKNLRLAHVDHFCILFRHGLRPPDPANRLRHRSAAAY